MKKVLLALDGNDEIAARFDYAPEVLIASTGEEKPCEVKTVVLARPSAEMICRMATSEGIGTVICGGIEKEYLDYLAWKKVEVIHSIIGGADSVLKRFREGRLRSCDILERRKA